MLLALLFTALLQGAGAVAQPGTIAGQLRTPDGAPVASVRVAALPAPRETIRPSDGQNYYATVVPVRTTLTDAQGRYRLTNLAPGRYLILGSVLGYPTYHPSTTAADEAVIVTVGPEGVAGVDVTILLPPGGRVSGQIAPAADPGSEERAVLAGLELGELLEAPIDGNGRFAFGHIPAGPYILSVFPTPPGMPSQVFQVEEGADSEIALKRPALFTVSGRFIVPKGPLPFGLLGFTTETSYVSGAIAPDGTFRARVHAALHLVDLGGMPVGYGIASVRQNGRDVSRGIEVRGADVTGIEITLAIPDALPAVRGRVTGLPPERLKGARVTLDGRLISRLEADVRADGSFEFAAVTPGAYWASIPGLPGASPVLVVVGLEDETFELRVTQPR